jgi:hypothetical protein
MLQEDFVLFRLLVACARGKIERERREREDEKSISQID